MASQPAALPKPTKGKLAAVPPRQKPFYPTRLDPRAMREKMLQPGGKPRKWEANLHRFFLDFGRLSSGAAQSALLLGIHLRTIAGYKSPVWTPPMLASDFAQEVQFSDQMMLEAIKNAVERGIIRRKGQSGPEAHQYQLAMEAWESLPNYFETRIKAEFKAGEEEEKPHETTVGRVAIGSGQKCAVKAGDVTVHCKNSCEQPLSIGSTISQKGELELDIRQEKASSLPRKAPESNRGRKFDPTPSRVPSAAGELLIAACKRLGLDLSPVVDQDLVGCTLRALEDMPLDHFVRELQDRLGRGGLDVSLLPAFAAEKLAKWRKKGAKKEGESKPPVIHEILTQMRKEGKIR